MQCTQGSSERIGGDENELAAVPDFDDGFRGATGKRDTLDDALDFARFNVALARGDAAGEDDVFEVEDGVLVIVKFIRNVGGNDVIERAHQRTNLSNSRTLRASILRR